LTPSSGITYWRQLAEQYGMTSWPSNMTPHDRHQWP
jgi:hypothetical protein